MTSFARRLLFITFISALAPRALAQGAEDKAQGQLLFEKGRVALAEGDFVLACSLFKQSSDLDRKVGTLGSLANCFEKRGMTASAWATYLDAAALAKQLGDPKREAFSAKRAAELRPQLSYLTIDASAVASTAGVEVRRNGAAIPRGRWSSELPVDPGEHSIEARAPDHETALVRVEVRPNGDHRVARLPALVKVVTAPPPPPDPTPAVPPPVAAAAPVLPAAPPAPPPSPPAAPQEPEPSPPAETSPVEVQSAAPPAPTPEKRSESTSLHKLGGYFAVGAGVASLGLGVVFYLSRNSHLERRDQACPAAPSGPCPTEPRRLEYETEQREAQSASTKTTVFTVAGAALGATGVVLLLTAPSRARADARTVRIAPSVGSDGGMVRMEGTW